MEYSDEYKAKVGELKDAGLTVQQIADEMGKTKKTMQRHISEMGLSVVTDRSDIRDEDVLEDWNMGLTINQIAYKHKCSHETITKRLKKYDIKCGRAEGIRKHFEVTYDDRWRAIKKDLDRGLSVTMVREIHHIRIENLQMLMERHGYRNFNESLLGQLQFRLDEERQMTNGRRNCIEYILAIQQYVNEYGMVPDIQAIKKITGRHRDTVKRAILRYQLSEFVDMGRVSSWVSVLKDYLQSHGVNYEMNNRTLLINDDGHRQEMDVYLPDLGIGIEVNPVGTHSVDTHVGIMTKDYHQKKSLLALKSGIPLVHMYDEDFVDKHLFSKIMNMILSTDKIKVGARQCILKNVSQWEANQFLDTYHLQGKEMRSKYRYGLYHNDELLCLLTIGASRYTKDSYEILRYCVRPDYIVIGSFQKLFHAFLPQCQHGETVVSYMDLDKRFSCENIYEKSGFVEDGLTQPDYVWVTKYGLTTLKRYDTTKSKLVKQGFDAKKTEREIMHERGFYQVYHAGSKRFIYTV